MCGVISESVLWLIPWEICRDKTRGNYWRNHNSNPWKKLGEIPAGIPGAISWGIPFKNFEKSPGGLPGGILLTISGGILWGNPGTVPEETS